MTINARNSSIISIANSYMSEFEIISNPKAVIRKIRFSNKLFLGICLWMITRQ